MIEELYDLDEKGVGYLFLWATLHGEFPQDFQDEKAADKFAFVFTLTGLRHESSAETSASGLGEIRSMFAR